MYFNTALMYFTEEDPWCPVNGEVQLTLTWFQKFKLVFFKFKTLIYNYCLCNGKRLFSRSSLLISQGWEGLAGNFLIKSVNRYHRLPYHNQGQLSLNLPRTWLDMETRQNHLSLLMPCWGIWQFALWLLNLSLPHKVAEDSGLLGYRILIFLTDIKFRLGVFFL